MNIQEYFYHSVVPWFTELRNNIRDELTNLEDQYGNGKFIVTPWNRKGGGGGEMSVIKGELFEKGGVNISTVHGKIDDTLAGILKITPNNQEFFASGISLVIHPKSPFVPIIHMNTRCFIIDNNYWFGGGIDLTPVFPDKDDTEHLHSTLKTTCDQFHPSYHQQFKKQCDEYFFIKHHNEGPKSTC